MFDIKIIPRAIFISRIKNIYKPEYVAGLLSIPIIGYRDHRSWN